MGLDVYVGSLTRYYARDWETVIQRYARESNLQVQIVRPTSDSDPSEVTDPKTIREVVDWWMNGIGVSLKPHLPAGISFGWRDDPAAPYFTDKPAWDCYGSLLLWAAYSEHPELMRPVEFVEKWNDDQAYLASRHENFKTKFAHLLDDIELWLPVDYRFTFKASDAAGVSVGIGSCHELLRELEVLNFSTWRADDATIAEWKSKGGDFQAPLEVGARFAFSVFHELATEAVAHLLPMKLDY